MKISKSKQELARIISENGGWRDGAEWAAQDGAGNDGLYNVAAYGERPVYVKDHAWHKPSNFSAYHEDWFKVSSPVNGWHQTILSRAEYFHLYPAPDADGWIEWKGGECPVEMGAQIDVKFRDGTMQPACDARGEKSPSHRYWTYAWSHSNHNADIIAYRMRKPEQSTVESRLADAVDIVKSAAPALMRDDMKFNGDEVMGERKPTIEQLAADYRNAKDYAGRKQQEADAAKADAEDKLKALELSCEALGFIVSPITAKQEPGLAITDWRDLLPDDVIKVHSFGSVYSECTVLALEGNDVFVRNHAGRKYRPDIKNNHWRFIRRP